MAAFWREDSSGFHRFFFDCVCVHDRELQPKPRNGNVCSPPPFACLLKEPNRDTRSFQWISSASGVFFLMREKDALFKSSVGFFLFFYFFVFGDAYLQWFFLTAEGKRGSRNHPEN